MADGFAKAVWLGIKALIAQSASFRTWTGTVLPPPGEGDTDVNDRIHIGSTPEDADLPCALIHPTDLVRAYAGVGVRVLGENSVSVTLIGNVSTDDVAADGQVNDWQAVITDLDDVVSKIAGDIEVSGEAGGYGPQVRQAYPAGTPEIDEQSRRALKLGDDEIHNARDLVLEIGLSVASA